MTDCLFCKIVAGQLPSEQVYQDEKVIVFKDKFPKAKVHLLVTSRKHIDSLFELNKNDADLMGHIVQLLPIMAKEQGLAGGFRTIVNTGKDGGQEINHLHFHILGGGGKLWA